MDLVDCCERGIGQERGDGKATVAGNRVGLVFAAIADIEARAFANRYAPAPAEEAVGKAAKADRPDDLDAQRSFLMMMSSSAWLPTMKA